MIFIKTNKELMNFKIPSHLKSKFQKKCNDEYQSMSSKLIEMIKTYISH